MLWWLAFNGLLAAEGRFLSRGASRPCLGLAPLYLAFRVGMAAAALAGLLPPEIRPAVHGAAVWLALAVLRLEKSGQNAVISAGLLTLSAPLEG